MRSHEQALGVPEVGALHPTEVHGDDTTLGTRADALAAWIFAGPATLNQIASE
jgi:hypothetical protein